MTRPAPEAVSTIAVIGAGTIGASWSAWYLARGFAVRLSDPDPSRHGFVQNYVASAWPALAKTGATGSAALAQRLTQLSFHDHVEDAVQNADFVQENAYERLDLKQALLARIDAALAPDRIVASSTSGFGATALQRDMLQPGRLVIGHPFNPPHLIPLVEVVGGQRTDEAAIEWALAFYRAVGKKPIRIRKEVPGHLANRLQAALWREAVHLVAEGVASVEDVDAAVAYGPGLRWALMGPHLTFHLGGGEGGMRHFVDHLGPPVESWWADLGRPHLTPQIKDKLVAGMAEAVRGQSVATLSAERDRKLVELLDMLGLARGDVAAG